MDPASKRSMWDLVQELRKMHAVVLTTHSMEEAEAICTRIGIMTQGHLRCLGPLHHLRALHGQGYHLTIQCPTASHVAGIHSLVSHTFPTAHLLEQGTRTLRYALPTNGGGVNLTLSDVFDIVERFEGVEDYSISQTSLEQVFLDFASAVGSDDDTQVRQRRAPVRYFDDSAKMEGTAAWLANILFATVGGGVLMAAGYVFVSLLAFMSVVFIPGGWWAIRRAGLALAPYGRVVVDYRVDQAGVRRRLPRWYRVMVNWGTVVCCGLLAAILHAFMGALLALTIVLWPFAKMHFRLAALALAPVWG
ncbi:hypothetical protein HK104_005495 [Borealophlyctis nickersoniae]|nr:hypothetical protein HK104_005495 [Borealophlyctis nickersoniae]